MNPEDKAPKIKISNEEKNARLVKLVVAERERERERERNKNRLLGIFLPKLQFLEQERFFIKTSNDYERYNLFYQKTVEILQAFLELGAYFDISALKEECENLLALSLSPSEYMDRYFSLVGQIQVFLHENNMFESGRLK